MARVPRAWNFNIDFIGRMHGILWVSAGLTLMSIVAICTIGLQMGTDFAGGYEIQVHFPQTVSESRIREVLEPLHLEDARVQRFGAETDNDFLILMRRASGNIDVDKQQGIRTALQEALQERSHLSSLRFAESGERLTATFDEAFAEDKLRAVLKSQQVPVVEIHRSGRDDKPEYVVQIESLADDIARALRQGLSLPQDQNVIERVEFVGPQVGADLRNEGLMAVASSLFLILIYVALRFDMFFAPGAIIATLHDLILTMGIFCIFRIDFNLTVVAAILTLIGFSLNDTIVVYDRIRENVARNKGQDLGKLINASINETLSRTILTSGTVLVVTMTLLLLGGPLLRGFSVIMVVGVIVGTYSSIAVASPVYMALRAYAERGRKAG